MMAAGTIRETDLKARRIWDLDERDNMAHLLNKVGKWNLPHLF